MANLSSRDPNLPSSSRASHLVHTVVTQVIISLDCSVTRATECVCKQIGLNVVLLDSKLFPIMDNESTSIAKFWHLKCKLIVVQAIKAVQHSCR